MTNLNSNELAAIVEYARENGRRWKSKLAADWMNGRTRGTLQNLRNSAQFGPAGLARFRLPLVLVTSTKIVHNRELGEYVVRAFDQYGRRMPKCDYFTDDLADAQGTAEEMLAIDAQFVN